MKDVNYKATKTRSDRPGWSVTFRHPKRTDREGRPGLKIRRGLNTADEREADRLVEQLNTLLNAPYWWSVNRKIEAETKFDGVIVDIFFDRIEASKTNSAELRDSKILLPTKEDGYSRVLFLGTTGAGKTTLLRHIIGSDHNKDRFPSTSTARTTTADTEIVTAEGSYQAVVTFTPEHEVRAQVEECLVDACLNVIQEEPDKKIATALLSHREQRFRMFYILGAWQEAHVHDEDDFVFTDETPEVELGSQETVNADEAKRNQKHLVELISRVKKLSHIVGKTTSEALDTLDKQDNPDTRADWLSKFSEDLAKNEEFSDIALDIMDHIKERFNFIKTGKFERRSTDWPTLWSFTENSRKKFLEQVRWFSSNHNKQFGKLLTPLVDGIRVQGPFRPKDMPATPKLVLIDSEGIGHSTKSATSISTRVTQRFSETDMILLVDNAQQPMQGAPLELLRSIGSSGHSDKIAVAFTHFDLVKGPNLLDHEQKCAHVMNSMRNAIDTLKQSIGVPVASILEKQIEKRNFFLGGLDRDITKILKGFQRQMNALLKDMQNATTPPSDINKAIPIYRMEGLEIALRDAVEGFQSPWKARLGCGYHEGYTKEHWSRLKALARRLAADVPKNEYDTLRPVADLIKQLQESISRWLDNPVNWNGNSDDKAARDVALNTIREAVSSELHDLAQKRLADTHVPDWSVAFQFSGIGSSYRRAEKIEHIYNEAAPEISSVMSNPAREFLNRLHELVRESVKEAGGQIQ